MGSETLGALSFQGPETTAADAGGRVVLGAHAGLAFVLEHQGGVPFVVHLGVVTEALAPGMARLSMALAAHFTNSFGTAHGGVILGLLDVALSTAARSLHPEACGVITIDLSTAFIGPATGPRLLAEGRVLRDGRSLIFAEGEARNTDGTLVAKAMATLRAQVAR